MRTSSVAATWFIAGLLSVTLLSLPLVAYAATTTVRIKDFSYEPKNTTIRVGDTVTWINNDTTSHTSTSPGTWDTGSLGFGLSRSVTFTTAGTYVYFCVLHSIMFGSVVVLEQNAPLPTATVTAPTPAPATAAPTSTTAANSTPAPQASEAAAAPPATAGAVVALRAPSEAGPGPLVVAGAALAIVALSAFAWLVARQT